MTQNYEFLKYVELGTNLPDFLNGSFINATEETPLDHAVAAKCNMFLKQYAYIAHKDGTILSTHGIEFTAKDIQYYMRAILSGIALTHQTEGYCGKAFHVLDVEDPDADTPCYWSHAGDAIFLPMDYIFWSLLSEKLGIPVLNKHFPGETFTSAEDAYLKGAEEAGHAATVKADPGLIAYGISISAADLPDYYEKNPGEIAVKPIVTAAKKHMREAQAKVPASRQVFDPLLPMVNRFRPEILPDSLPAR